MATVDLSQSRRVRSRPWEIVVESDVNHPVAGPVEQPLAVPTPHRLDLPESSVEAFRMGYEEALREVAKRSSEER